MELSIIVPVYNVERYIRPCIESIFRQGLKDSVFEVIIVNDGSTDKSIEMIADIINQHNNITIITQENQGLSMARNNGMDIATGEYLMYLDSDDLFIDNSLSTFIEIAIQSNADLIVADYKRMEDEEINTFLKINTTTHNNICKIQEKTGFTLFLEDLNPKESYVWRTIYKKDFLTKNKIQYTPGVCFEDIPFTHECYLKAGKCLRIHKPFYIYRIGHASISATINERTGKDFGTIIAKTCELRNLDGLTPKIRERLNDNIFAALSILLYGITHDVQNSAERRAIMKHLKEVAPNLYFTHGKKQKIISFIYYRIPYTYITIRSLLVKTIKKLK